jgi:hypothetical protein
MQVDSDETSGVAAAWLMIAAMVAFKLGLTIYILVAYPSAQNTAMQILLNLHWWILLGVLAAVAVIAWGPLLRMWARLVRMRRRRAALLRAEWRND